MANSIEIALRALMALAHFAAGITSLYVHVSHAPVLFGLSTGDYAQHYGIAVSQLIGAAIWALYAIAGKRLP